MPPTFLPAADLIAQNPHPAFDKIRARGYEIWFLLERGDDERDLLIMVRAGGDVVATADFSEDDVLTAHCQNIWVNPDRQRQGIANAVYVFAELVLGRVLRDYWRDDSHQSEAAQALWAQSNRPFGHLPARGSS